MLCAISRAQHGRVLGLTSPFDYWNGVRAHPLGRQRQSGDNDERIQRGRRIKIIFKGPSI